MPRRVSDARMDGARAETRSSLDGALNARRGLWRSTIMIMILPTIRISSSYSELLSTSTHGRLLHTSLFLYAHLHPNSSAMASYLAMSAGLLVNRSWSGLGAPRILRCRATV